MSTRPTKAIAVDWSGAKSREGADGIAIAIAERGELVEVVTGVGRTAAIERIIGESSTGELIAGFDFSFSLPAWFLESQGLPDAPALWDRASVEGEEWLERCEPPFWGRPGAKQPAHDPDRPQLRETDRLTITESDLSPRQARSPFQVSGAGSVGASTIRGLPHLSALRRSGFSIWPWDSPSPPLAIEIWTRVAIGETVKRDPEARSDAVAAEPRIPDRLAAAVAGSEDCFDAAISALWIHDHWDEVLSRPSLSRPADRLEGRTWIPVGANDP